MTYSTDTSKVTDTRNWLMIWESVLDLYSGFDWDNNRAQWETIVNARREVLRMQASLEGRDASPVPMELVTLSGTTVAILAELIDEEGLAGESWAQAVLQGRWRRCGNGGLVTASMSEQDHRALTQKMVEVAAEAIATNDYGRFKAA